MRPSGITDRRGQAYVPKPAAIRLQRFHAHHDPSAGPVGDHGARTGDQVVVAGSDEHVFLALLADRR